MSTKGIDKYRIDAYKEKHMTGMILFGIISCIALIGIFWGRESLIYIGVFVFIITLFGLSIISKANLEGD